MSSQSCAAAAGDATAEELLERARALVPPALAAARAATGFGGRWKAIPLCCPTRRLRRPRLRP